MASIAKRSVSRWRARYRDTKSKELARQFRRKINAQRSLDSVTTPTTTRTYVDPYGGASRSGSGQDDLATRQRGQSNRIHAS